MTNQVELRLVYKGNGIWKEESSCNIGLAEQVHVFREVPEPRKPREWWVEVPIDGSIGQLFQNREQKTKGNAELVRVREIIEE